VFLSTHVHLINQGVFEAQQLQLQFLFYSKLILNESRKVHEFNKMYQRNDFSIFSRTSRVE